MADEPPSGNDFTDRLFMAECTHKAPRHKAAARSLSRGSNVLPTLLVLDLGCSKISTASSTSISRIPLSISRGLGFIDHLTAFAVETRPGFNQGQQRQQGIDQAQRHHAESTRG